MYLWAVGEGREGEGDEYDDDEAEFELWLAARTRPRDSIASGAKSSVRSALSELTSSSSSGVACAGVALASNDACDGG